MEAAPHILLPKASTRCHLPSHSRLHATCNSSFFPFFSSPKYFDCFSVCRVFISLFLSLFFCPLLLLLLSSSSSQTFPTLAAFLLNKASIRFPPIASNMAGSKVEKDLKMLSELLHQQVSLLEHPDEDDTSSSEPNETAALVHTNTPSTEAPGSSSHRSRPVQGDGPVKFEKDEFAPRAKTSGAYDCDGYVVGEPVSADVVFCPWKIAESYPDHFIGKTNRPHVGTHSCWCADGDENVTSITLMC